MPWTRGVHVGVLLLSSCSLCSVAPAVEHVRTKKQWLALIDAPTGGKTSPETGVFTRSSATSVVTCTRESWIKDAFESVAEVFHDRFQFLHSEDRKLCRELSLRDDRIGLVTSIYQSATTGERDLQSLDLRGRAAEANVATLPPRMARGQLQEFLASATLPLVGFLTVDSMMSGYNTARPLVTLFCPFSSVSDEIDPQDVDSRVTRQNMFARSSQAAWCRAPLVAAMGLLSASDTQSNVAAAVAEIEEHRQMELQEFGYDDLDGVGVGARTSAGFKYRLEPTDQVPPAQVLAEFVRNVIAAERQGDHGTGVVTYQHHGEDGSARTLQPYLKSAARPRPSKEAVRTVVGETFRDIVQSERDDVLVRLSCRFRCIVLSQIGVLLSDRALRTVVRSVSAYAIGAQDNRDCVAQEQSQGNRGCSIRCHSQRRAKTLL